MTASLKVNRSDLARALKVLRKFIKPKQREEAVLSFENGLLSIELVGAGAKVPAEGEWPGQARIASGAVLGFARALPKDDPLPLRVDEGRFYLAGLSVPCSWQDSERKKIQLILDPPIHVILGLRMRYSDEEITQSGLMKTVQQAEERRDGLVKQASKLLEPLGVTPTDLQPLVDECVRRKNEA